MASNPARRPAIVVGAGPVGLTAALALRARQVPVLLLEADPAQRVRPGSGAIYQHRASLDIYERLRPGLGRELARRGVVWPTKRTFYRGRQVYAKTYPRVPDDGRLPPLTSLPQTEIEAVLLRACEQAGVQILWQTPIEAVVCGREGVRLAARDGTLWDAEYVVAADGARSALRAALGIAMDGPRTDSSFVIVDVAEDARDPMPLQRVYHYQHPGVAGRNVLCVPFSGGWRVDLQCRTVDDAERHAGGRGLHDWLSAVLPARYAGRVTWVSTYRFAQAVAGSFVDPAHRVLLVGEAAHLFPPFGARGLNSGVADADAAAAALQQALGAANPLLSHAAVAAFAREREEAARWNRFAASQALAFMEARHPLLKARQEIAARLAPRVARAGRWLDAAPYGPRVPPGRAAVRY